MKFIVTVFLSCTINCVYGNTMDTSNYYFYVKQIDINIISNDEPYLYKKVIDEMYSSKKYGVWFDLSNPENVIKTFASDTARFMKFQDQKRRMILLPSRKYGKVNKKNRQKAVSELEMIRKTVIDAGLEISSDLNKVIMKLNNNQVNKIAVYGIYLQDGEPVGPSENDMLFLYKGLRF